MERMGHDSVRAAMIYQHKTSTAGQAIADAISGAVQEPGTRPMGRADGTLRHDALLRRARQGVCPMSRHCLTSSRAGASACSLPAGRLPADATPAG